MTTWRKEISDRMADHGDSWDDVQGMAPANLDLDREFYAGFGSAEGEPFTLWTSNRVYFPSQYDGSEDVASVPRHPCDEATYHVGG